jgi:hypothetical protein
MPEDMPDRMPEGMPDRMPNKMSDRMPEYLPVTKCINVMVGITRSKVIWNTVGILLEILHDIPINEPCFLPKHPASAAQLHPAAQHQPA